MAKYKYKVEMVIETEDFLIKGLDDVMDLLAFDNLDYAITNCKISAGGKNGKKSKSKSK